MHLVKQTYLRFITIGIVICFISACSENNNQSLEKSTTASDFKTYNAKSFYETTFYYGNSISHDGKKILFTSDQSGVFNVYSIPFNGGEIKQLTHSTNQSIFSIGWFKNSDNFLFTSDQDGNELNHIYVKFANGDQLDLTPGEKLKASFAGWSKDGSRFWIASNERNLKLFDLYEYDSKDFGRKLIFENNDNWSISDISDDGRWLVLFKIIHNADNDIYLVDLTSDSKSPTLITEHEGDITHKDFTFTSDNKHYIYGTDEHSEFTQAWSYNLETGKSEPLIKEDWDVWFVYFTENGKYRISGTNHDASTKVSVIDTTSNKAIDLPKLPEGDIRSLHFSKDETRLSFYINSDTSPSDLYSIDLKTNKLNRLTHALNTDIKQAHLVNGEVVRYKSFDGLEIPGILYKPHNASKDNRMPVLVNVHGGPGGQSRKSYSAQTQHLLNNGYAIFSANNRGSSGYGKTFFHLDDRKHGEDDLQDIVYARRYLETLDWVDKDRIGIIGGSYGGFMVAAALAFEPDVFDVGIDIFGVTNWERTLSNMPPWWESFKKYLYAEMGDPATDKERHRRISPLFHAKNIVKPLMVVQGANDPRVLKIESDELVNAVKANNIPVEYLVFADEGHGFLKKENRITFSEKALTFLNTYLTKKLQ